MSFCIINKTNAEISLRIESDMSGERPHFTFSFLRKDEADDETRTLEPDAFLRINRECTFDYRIVDHVGLVINEGTYQASGTDGKEPCWIISSFLE